MKIKNPFKKVDEETKAKLEKKLTANEFMNILDIQNDILYSEDNKLFIYLKIQPISLELLSPRERKAKGKDFSSEFSSIKRPYKFFSTSRPVDVSFMIDNFNRRRSETDNIKMREVLSQKINEVNQFALSGEILEHQFFMIIWEDFKNAESEREILKAANEIAAKFKTCKVDVSICKKGEIVKLINLFANPNYAHLESEDTKEYIPYID